MANTEEYNLKKELYDLFEMIQRIRREIAGIRYPQSDFSDMNDQLEAIVGTTAVATNEILENIENISTIATNLKKDNVETQQVQLDEIEECISNIMISCSFQDITGQRISKVVKVLRHIEDRVNTLVNMWGEKEISTEQVDVPEETDIYKRLTVGPALPGKGITQEDADRIMSIAKDIENTETEAETKPEVKTEKEAKPETKPEAKTEAKTEPETKPEAKAETKAEPEAKR